MTNDDLTDSAVMVEWGTEPYVHVSTPADHHDRSPTVTDLPLLRAALAIIEGEVARLTHDG